MATQQTVSQSFEQLKPAVISIPKQPPVSITQKELIEVILLRNVLRQRQEQLEFLESEIKTRLQAGADVEEGVHIAALRECFRRNVAWREIAESLGERLFGQGKGEPYCEEVLASTTPTRTLSMQVR